MQKAVPIFAIIFATLLALLSFSGCNPVGKKIGMAEKAFDRGDYETAQFEYFELLSSTSGDVQEKAAQSLFNRAAELVSSSSFDPHDYFEWAALFDTLPEYKAKLDAGFAKSITARAQALLDSGETTESAILIGYLPDGQDDNGLGVRIAQAHEARQEEIFNSGMECYKNHDYDGAIAEWETLDPSGERMKEANEIIDRIPAEKEKQYIQEAMKRPVEGMTVLASGPLMRIIFNRIKGKTFEMETAGEGRQFLRINARISKDIELYAWYKDEGNFKSLGSMRREFVWLVDDDPEIVKQIYKQTIASDHPMEVVYFINTQYGLYREQDIYVSTEMSPYNVDDLKEIAILLKF
ncbi:hypothetical protein J7K50_04140 [bacterium]|nr:hypothetical protein [bacterium]